ncbi:Hypothetical protein, putative, partial [Bodo saltans]
MTKICCKSFFVAVLSLLSSRDTFPKLASRAKAQKNSSYQMVLNKIVIVDVDAALKNNEAVLRLIKDKYQSIAQLSHFRKSHQVHFVGPASAQNDIYLAMNDVYAAVGEPFSFSKDDKTLFLKLVEEITPDKMEAFLRDQFKPGECFARDDKLRHGWRMSGPMYGVCAPTAERRKELLHSCVVAINRQYGTHFTQLSTAGFLIDDYVPKSTNGELTAPHGLQPVLEPSHCSPEEVGSHLCTDEKRPADFLTIEGDAKMCNDIFVIHPFAAAHIIATIEEPGSATEKYAENIKHANFKKLHIAESHGLGVDTFGGWNAEGRDFISALAKSDAARH